MASGCAYVYPSEAQDSPNDGNRWRRCFGLSDPPHTATSNCTVEAALESRCSTNRAVSGGSQEERRPLRFIFEVVRFKAPRGGTQGQTSLIGSNCWFESSLVLKTVSACN